MASPTTAIATVYTSGTVPTDTARLKGFGRSLGQGAQKFAAGVWSDFKATNTSPGKRIFTLTASLAAGPTVAGYFETSMPLGWAMRGFGPLPAEFTKSGAIRVFEYTFRQRAVLVAQSAAARFVLVTIAFEGGVLIGSVINQTLPDDTKDAIGGTINEIVNEGGWKDLWKHPFGFGLF
jgi:hypothetical protein